MSIIISGKTPTLLAPAAWQAYSGGPEHAGKHGPRPLNIIWGDSPK